MAAILSSGYRAVATEVSAETGAGGFILPNDRVDLMLTTQVSDSPRRFRAVILIHDVRVLAIDQASSNEKNPDKNQKPVSDVRTATLELSPQQAELVARSQATGTLSLALRSLVDQAAVGRNRVLAARAKYMAEGSDLGEVSVIRYGVARPAAASGGQ
jgi:pilus assembly protein CpaB